MEVVGRSCSSDAGGGGGAGCPSWKEACASERKKRCGKVERMTCMREEDMGAQLNKNRDEGEYAKLCRPQQLETSSMWGLRYLRIHALDETERRRDREVCRSGANPFGLCIHIYGCCSPIDHLVYLSICSGRHALSIIQKNKNKNKNRSYSLYIISRGGPMFQLEGSGG